MTYDFESKLNASKGARQESDAETIKCMLEGCETVVTAGKELDRQGVDFVATLRGGAEVLIDMKSRVPGCSKYWRNGEPELAIEIWSVMKGGKFNSPTSKAGWTLDESKITDMILYVFDAKDTNIVYLLPFQSLRMAARKMLPEWQRRHKVDVQTSNSWESKAVFVPASQVIQAMELTFSAEVIQSQEEAQLSLF